MNELNQKIIEQARIQAEQDGVICGLKDELAVFSNIMKNKK